MVNSYDFNNYFCYITFFFFIVSYKWTKKARVLCYTSGLYYKHVTIVIYDRNDSVQYHKTTITIVIDDP
jgi:hypothetical protein